MPAASALGPLGVSALALLVERPMHPYEMYQLLVSRTSNRIVKVRPGSLYHTVDKLAAVGYVEATGTQREGNRPERTTYAITPVGREALESRVIELLETPVNEYPVFPVAIAEAHNLPRATVIELLGRRLAQLHEERDAVRVRLGEAAREGVARRWTLAGDYYVTRMEADISWISAVLTDLESGALEWDEKFPGASGYVTTHKQGTQ